MPPKGGIRRMQESEIAFSADKPPPTPVRYRLGEWFSFSSRPISVSPSKEEPQN
jgi:hypothetical protein